MPRNKSGNAKSQPSAGPSSQADSDDVYMMEDPDEGSSTQRQSQARKVASGMANDIKQQKVSDLVKYLMIMNQKKYPIKRIDINKVVLKEHSKAFPLFMEEASKVLKDVYGLELVEMDSKIKSYIIVNMLEQDVEMPMEWSPEDNCRMALIMVILSVIFMKDNVIRDGELYHFLKKLGVNVDAHHDTFGDVRKLITVEFVRQGYLEFIKLPNTEPLAFEFRWGPRAKNETSKRYVLDFVSQIYDIDNPQIWANQFGDMVQSEQAQDEDDMD